MYMLESTNLDIPKLNRFGEKNPQHHFMPNIIYMQLLLTAGIARGGALFGRIAGWGVSVGVPWIFLVKMIFIYVCLVQV